MPTISKSFLTVVYTKGTSYMPADPLAKEHTVHYLLPRASGKVKSLSAGGSPQI